MKLWPPKLPKPAEGTYPVRTILLTVWEYVSALVKGAIGTINYDKKQGPRL